MLANRLLHSAKPGHIKPGDQSAAKKIIMVIKAKGAHVEFRLDKLCVQTIVTVTAYSS